MTTLQFSNDLLGEFMKKLAFVNSQLEKNGLPLIKIISLDSIKHINDVTGNAEKWAKIVLEGPKTMHLGTEYIGMIAFKEGIKQVFTFDEEVVLGAIPEDQLTCDHCHQNRKRVKYFFFRKEGKLLSIGSTCAKDYFGWDIERYLDCFVYLTDIADELKEESKGGYGQDSRHSGIFLDDLILATYMATMKWNSWISKDKAEVENRSSTGSMINHVLYPYQDHETAEEKSEFRRTLTEDFYTNVKTKLVERYGNITPINDFEFNIFNNLFFAPNELREFVVSPGIVGYAIYSVMHEKIESDLSTSTFVGTLGEKIMLKVKILETKSCNTAYGESILLLMQDEAENVIKSFSTSAFAYNAKVGDSYRIIGTVKAHDVYRGIKQTLLTRVKVTK